MIDDSKALRLGTRASALARWQAEWVAARLRGRGVAVNLVPITTRGDQHQAAIRSIGGEGVFTKELERALLDGRIDLAVQSEGSTHQRDGRTGPGGRPRAGSRRRCAGLPRRGFRQRGQSHFGSPLRVEARKSGQSPLFVCLSGPASAPAACTAGPNCFAPAPTCT